MAVFKEKNLRDKELLKFLSYEDYLESFITARDLYHLRSKAISRQIIELGYHTQGTLSRNTFYNRVKHVKRYLYLLEHPFDLCSENIDPKDTLLQELAIREKANRIGEMNTIIFVQYIKAQYQISAFIDYATRLKLEDWQPYFKMTKIIKPMKSDLSYYDWKHRIIISNESPNFKPIVNGKNGLVFQNNHDLKLVSVGSNLISKTDPARYSIYSETYGHVTLYDHVVQI